MSFLLETFIRSWEGQHGQTVMSQLHIFKKRLNSKKYKGLGGNFYKILEIYGSNRIVRDTI